MTTLHDHNLDSLSRLRVDPFLMKTRSGSTYSSPMNSMKRSSSPRRSRSSTPQGRRANLRINRKCGHSRAVPGCCSQKKSKKTGKSPIKKGGRAKPISHATRIVPTNLSYKDLLRKHQFTPSGESSSRSPMKESFNALTASSSLQSNESPSHESQPNESQESIKSTPPPISLSNSNLSPLDVSREEFRRRPIVEEPKKNVTGYQLFARWKRAQIESKTSSKAISAAWSLLSESEKTEWIKRSDAAKKEYHRKKELFMDYCQEARRLGIAVPTKSVKPLIQPIKIKNLLHLIPDISKFNRETQFVISKATEKFISFYASKAAEVSQRRRKHDHPHPDTTTISNNDCFYALQSDERFHFLRAVAIRTPSPSKRGTKRKLRDSSSSDHDGDAVSSDHDEEHEEEVHPPRSSSIPSSNSNSASFCSRSSTDTDITPQHNSKRRKLCWTEHHNEGQDSPSQSTATSASTSTSTSTSTPTHSDQMAPLPHFSITQPLPHHGHMQYHNGYQMNHGYAQSHDGYQAAPGVIAPFATTLPLPMNGMQMNMNGMNGLPPFPRIDGLPGHGMNGMMNPFDHNMYHQQSDYRAHSSPKSQIVSVDEMFKAED